MPLQQIYHGLGLTRLEPDVKDVLARLQTRKIEAAGACGDRPSPEAGRQRPLPRLERKTSVLAVRVACLPER